MYYNWLQSIKFENYGYADEEPEMFISRGQFRSVWWSSFGSILKVPYLIIPNMIRTVEAVIDFAILYVLDTEDEVDALGNWIIESLQPYA